MPEIPRAQDQLFNTRQSAREKYASLVVGRPGWGPLLHHELVTLCSQHVPVHKADNKSFSHHARSVVA